jgi:hypothetical protein
MLIKNRRDKPTRQAPHPLLNRKIYSQGGRQLGRIVNLVTNPGDDATAFAVLQLGITQPEEPFADLPENLEFSTDGRSTLTLGLGKDLGPTLSPLDGKSIEDINRQEQLSTVFAYNSQLQFPM